MVWSRWRKALRALFVAGLGLLVLAGWRKGRLEPPVQLLPQLLQDPVQGPTRRTPFSFDYKGKRCSVKPVATYELWGLVVSHNDIHSVADIYHDTTSVDTKDLCVVWGDNVRRGDYLRADFASGPFTCYVSWSDGVTLRMDQISNNHLITDSPAVRAAIERVELGDQVHFEGLLVDYQMPDWRDFWRRTSTVRTDSGCEVVFVEQLEVLRRGTPAWYALWRVAWGIVLGIPLLYLWVFWMEAKSSSVSLGEI